MTVLIDNINFTSGQNGKVYKGLLQYHKTCAEVEVAIKTIKMCGSKNEREDFLKEMNVMSTLLHPNIVRFFGLTKQGRLCDILTKESESYNKICR